MRVRRSGYLPFLSSELTLPRAKELVLNVESPHVELEGIVVNSKSPCKRTDPDSRSLATVWDEIDKALRSSQLTTSDLKGIGWGRTYRRETRSDGSIISADTNVFKITDHRPFGAIDPAALATRGYVLGDEDKGWSYFAPDEAVLMSDEFASTHCFRLVRSTDRRGQIGVAFEPVPRRKQSDIAGVIWVDRATAELREIVFRFVNAKALSRFDSGGFTRFRRVASGTWIVNEWKLSVPRLQLKQAGPYTSPKLVSVGRVDNGGGIFESLDPVRPTAKPDSLTRKQ